MTDTLLSPLLKLMDAIWDISVRHIRKNPDSELMSQFWAETDQGKRLVFLAPWRDAAEKTATIVTLMIEFQEKRVKRYVLAGECWVARDEGAPPDDGSFVMPSKRPDRIEMLQVLGVDPEAGEILQYHGKIARKGGKRRVGNRQSPTYPGGIEGRMTELLGPVARTVN